MIRIMTKDDVKEMQKTWAEADILEAQAIQIQKKARKAIKKLEHHNDQLLFQDIAEQMGLFDED